HKAGGSFGHNFAHPNRRRPQEFLTVAETPQRVICCAQLALPHCTFQAFGLRRSRRMEFGIQRQDFLEKRDHFRVRANSQRLFAPPHVLDRISFPFSPATPQWKPSTAADPTASVFSMALATCSCNPRRRSCGSSASKRSRSLSCANRHTPSWISSTAASSQ